MTRRERILAAIVAALAGTTGVSTRIYRSRVEPLSRGEAPAIVVEPLNDSAEQNAVPKLDWALAVRVSVIVRGIVPDQIADPIVQSMHSKIMADKSLGGYAQDIQPRSVSFDFIESDQPTGVISCDYVVTYRTAEADLTTA